jgi:hypothetical protein
MRRATTASLRQRAFPRSAARRPLRTRIRCPPARDQLRSRSRIREKQQRRSDCSYPWRLLHKPLVYPVRYDEVQRVDFAGGEKSRNDPSIAARRPHRPPADRSRDARLEILQRLWFVQQPPWNAIATASLLHLHEGRSASEPIAVPAGAWSSSISEASRRSVAKTPPSRAKRTCRAAWQAGLWRRREAQRHCRKRAPAPTGRGPAAGTSYGARPRWRRGGGRCHARAAGSRRKSGRGP